MLSPPPRLGDLDGLFDATNVITFALRSAVIAGG
jgi:hypothetical protein